MVCGIYRTNGEFLIEKLLMIIINAILFEHNMTANKCKATDHGLSTSRRTID